MALINKNDLKQKIKDKDKSDKHNEKINDITNNPQKYINEVINDINIFTDMIEDEDVTELSFECPVLILNDIITLLEDAGYNILDIAVYNDERIILMSWA